ncbi:TRAP transporter small permease [Martelella lutilitoris]|uniref:TRAP transporter small permease protein n=1 Tax=Martelella lutilitoris TaxID=2583532 RepID=A0A7T7HL98_9HYPH|nr:TRAP transporter small permease [Martelella lutilitoris]QQM31276.1 TRAP transporter small permease [Martelella lutilitoris]
MNPLGKISAGLVQLERWASRFLVVGFVGLIVANVGMRYLAGRPIIFAEELAAIMLVWLAFIATSISIHTRAQIGVTLLVDNFSEPWRRIIDLLVWLLITIMLAILLKAGIAWVRSPVVEFEQVITTGWAKAPFFTIFPIFCASALVHSLAHVARAAGEIRGKRA